jgi:hypothetical protein
MPEYEIMRWDSVIPKNNTLPYPMIYIKPDKNFEYYATENKNMFLVNISGTGMDYDNIPVVGMTDLSAFFPDFRPYFFNETGYYVIVLFANWAGYPENNGKVKIQGIKGPDQVIPEPVELEIPKLIEPEYFTEPLRNNENNCGKLTSTQLGWVLISIMIVFGVLIAISFRKKIL